MRGGYERSLACLALALACACGESGADEDGELSEDAVGSPACLEFEPCGGDPVGTWELDETCFPDGYPSVGADPACPGAINRIVDYGATGRLELHDDGSYENVTTGTTTQQMLLPLECVGGEPEYCEAYGEGLSLVYGEEAGCSVNGSSCDCTLVVSVDVVDTGTWSTAGTNFTMSSSIYANSSTQSFCADADELALDSSSATGDRVVGLWQRVL